MAMAMTMGHGRGGKRAVVQTSRTTTRHLSAGLGHYLTFLLDALLSGSLI
jgi:hypothetical protein